MLKRELTNLQIYGMVWKVCVMISLFSVLVWYIVKDKQKITKAVKFLKVDRYRKCNRNIIRRFQVALISGNHFKYNSVDEMCRTFIIL